MMQGTLLSGQLNARGVAKYSDFGAIKLSQDSFRDSYRDISEMVIGLGNGELGNGAREEVS